MANAYERQPVIVIINIEFSKWGVIVDDEKLASTVIGGIVHCSCLMEFNGASIRMEAVLVLDKSGA